MRRTTYGILLGIAVASGLLIAWVDSRPGWDDTGISAGMILLMTGLLGFIHPKNAWQWALAVGVWIPLFGIVSQGNVAAVLALGVGIVGAYAGAIARRAITQPHEPMPRR